MENPIENPMENPMENPPFKKIMSETTGVPGDFAMSQLKPEERILDAGKSGFPDSWRQWCWAVVQMVGWLVI